MTESSWLSRYLLPGLVFQSVMVGGGYGTGRELVEFFLRHGPRGGLVGMAVATVTISVICAICYEFARLLRAFDYRSFMRELLGPFWIAYEVLYILFVVIVLAVVGAASGAILQETFGLPYAVGVAVMIATVGVLVLRGSGTIARTFVWWSAILYLVYGVFFVWSFLRFRPEIASGFAAGRLQGPWLVDGVRYASYNLAIPAVLFVLVHLQSRREAVVAGLLTGPVAVMPGVLFFIALVSHYPAVVDRPIPANFLLDAIGSGWFQGVYQIMLFGTLIETGTGMIHSVNERIAATVRERGGELAPLVRPALGVGALVLAAILSRAGIINLIAKGYGTLAWTGIALFILPVLTVGLWKISRRPRVGSR